jgi:alpha-tubulin suppressor-like RCC1 family protein
VSSSVTGSRAIGAVTRQWQRSTAASSDGSYTNISNATTATFNDTAAPADGSPRYYRIRLTAAGADTLTTEPVLGRRLAITQISAGTDLNGSHSCALAVGGRVWCWGQQSNGRLGNGLSSTATVSIPIRVPNLFNVTQVSAGGSHTCVRNTEKEIWCWGFGNSGRLGHGLETDSLVPVKVSPLGAATQVSAGSASTCARLEDSSVWCWGSNTWYALGDGTTTSSPTPKQVRTSASVTLTSVSSVSSSSVSFGFLSCATRTSGLARCWGREDLVEPYQGYLGHGTTSWNGYPVPVSGSLAFSQISTGQLYACGIANGTLYCWGSNLSGQLGLGDIDLRLAPEAVALPNFTPAQVAATSNQTCVRSSDGNVRCWGGGVSTPPTSNKSGLAEVTDLVGNGSFFGLVSGGVKTWSGTGTPTDVAFP